jgi:hypothetical protein
MKSCVRGRRILVRLQKELRRFRLAYAGVLARKVKVRGDLPARILATKAKIARLIQDLNGRQDAA